MFRSPKKIYIPILLTLILFSFTAGAQIRIASPYSRFGIGMLRGNNNAWNFGMGGLGVGIRSPYHVNFTNPASYTAFDSTSFVFEGGFLSEFVTLKTNFSSDNRNYTSLGYLLFGMPVTKWWRTALGIVPFSDVGYNLQSDQVVTGIGLESRVYSGEGGINRFFWGNGFKITKKLSVGLNISYLFGSMNREAVAKFPDSVYFLNLKSDSWIMINDLYLNYGIQYIQPLKKNMHIVAGAVFATQSNMSAETNTIAQNYIIGSDGTENVRDTLLNLAAYHGKIVLPWMFGLGISIDKTDKWMAGADFKWQNWKEYTAFGLSDSLVNSYQVSAGAEFLPDQYNFSNYLKRIRYRVGVMYNSSYLELRGQHLKEYALSVGLGLPLKGMKTNLNLSMQVGSYGTTSSDLIQESYFKFSIGFSIYERWFVKRKYF
jgi:hypothetical protein